MLSVENNCFIVYCLRKLLSQLTTTDNEEFPLDDCTFPTVKKPESYRDVSISDTLRSEQRKEVET